MPDHGGWPPILRIIEQVARASSYAAVAWAGWTLVPSLLGILAVVAGLVGVVAATGRWWHAEMVAVAVLPWPFLSLAVLAHEDVVSALCVFVATMAVRRLTELHLFSTQVRRARRRRVERWQQVASRMLDGEDT